MKIPCISVPPVPITYPISEFPNMAIAPTANWGAALNRLSFSMMGKADLPSLKEINDFRRKTLGLPARKAGVYTYEFDGRLIPIICPVNPALFEDVKSWNGRVYLPGFMYLDVKDQALNPEIEAFLSNGDRPIVASFGSMPLHRPQAFLSMLSDALKMTGNRAVLLTGEMDVSVGGDDSILAAKSALHGLLFPRAKGIVHPFSGDQPFWAHRLLRLGYALPPLREKFLSVAKLADAFRDGAPGTHPERRADPRAAFEGGRLRIRGGVH